MAWWTKVCDPGITAWFEDFHNQKNKLGGVCLNMRCIPTEALLKSAEAFETSTHMEEFGIKVEGKVTGYICHSTKSPDGEENDRRCCVSHED